AEPKVVYRDRPAPLQAPSLTPSSVPPAAKADPDPTAKPPETKPQDVKQDPPKKPNPAGEEGIPKGRAPPYTGPALAGIKGSIAPMNPMMGGLVPAPRNAEIAEQEVRRIAGAESAKVLSSDDNGHGRSIILTVPSKKAGTLVERLRMALGE